ncbi:Transcriptional regulator, MarR family [uncultured Paludibacter sp.]|nr:Transcriptional regulator, MarR family [uncultured Paludibacter sp.]
MGATIELEELFLVLTGKISSAINKAVLRGFATNDIDITTEQWTVMACLWKEDKVTQQKLCDLTSKDKPSITRLIDNLEKRNLVTRVSDPGDRRINLIHLTSKGEQLQTKAMESIQKIAEKALSDIEDTELNISKNVLKKIIGNLQ